MRSYFHRYGRIVRSLPKAVLWLTAAAFVNACGVMVVTFLALYLTQVRGLSVASAGEVVATFGFGSLLGGYLGGRSGDRFDSRLILAISFITMGIGFFTLSVVDDLALFRVVLFATGAFEGAFRPAYNLTLTRVCPPEKLTLAYSFSRMAYSLGFGLATLLAGTALSLDPHYVFWIDAGTSIAAGLVILTCWRRIAVLAEPPAPASNGAESPRRRDYRVLGILVAIGAAALVYFQIKNAYPNYLRDVYGLSAFQYACLFALQSFLIIAVEPLLTERLLEVPRQYVAACGSMLLCAGFAIAPLGHSLAWAVTGCLFWSFGSMLLFPAAVAMVSGLAPAGQKGRYLGLYQLVFSTCSILAPAGGGYIWAWAGSDAVWHLAGIIGLCSAALFMLAATRLHPRTRGVVGN